MATLDVVSQPTVPPRVSHALNRGKGEIETDGQTGGGFDDILAQSGAKEDASEADALDNKPAEKPVRQSPANSFHQAKFHLAQKHDAEASNPTIKSPAPSLVDISSSLADAEETKGDSTKELVAQDPKKIEVMSLLKAKSTLNGQLTEIAKNSDLFRNEAIDNLPTDNPVADDITVGVKPGPSHKIAKELETDKTDRSDKPVTSIKTEFGEKTEKTGKIFKHGGDKKADSTRDPNKSNPADADLQEGVKGILDILGANQANAIIPLTAVADAKPKTAEPVDNAIASVLEAVSQPVTTNNDKRIDAVDDKKVPKSADKADHGSTVDPDTIFRFSKADSSEKPVDIRIGNKEKPTDEGVGSAVQQNKTENVVVLEARRYLALAPDSNAFNLVSHIAGSKELTSALTSSIIDPDKNAATSKVVNTLKLQMNPHDLGTVTATLRLRGEELSVAITVQNSAAYNHLSIDQDKMVDALRAQGFAVDQITLQLVNPDRSSFQDPQQQSNGQAQQQQTGDGATAQQGRQQGNGSPQDNAARRSWQNSETAGSGAPGVAGGDRGDGQVYV